MNFKNIVFFYPSMITGGAEYYFLRLAQYVSTCHNEYKIYYIEYLDGFARSKTEGCPINFIDYQKNKAVCIPPCSVVCTSLHHVADLDTLINYDPQNSICTFWFLHLKHLSYQYTMDNYYKVGRKTRIQVGKIIEQMSDMGVLKFLGNVSYLTLSKQFLFKYKPIEPIPIPITTDKYGIDYCCNKTIGDITRFCWLGRLDKEKSRNIITYMNELEEINKTHKLTLSLIGNGPAENIIRAQAKKYSYKIEFVGEKRDDQLDSFIRNNVDIGLASGTSSLEFMLRKVPVIENWLLDRIYEARSLNNFYIAGFGGKIEITGSDGFRRSNETTFSNVYTKIIDNYNNICEQSFNFTFTQSPKACGEKFVSAIDSLNNVNLSVAYELYKELIFITKKSKYNWMEKLHLRRIYVPFCKLLGVKPAFM